MDLQIASGEKRIEELSELFYKEKVVKDSPERFRCAMCNKMFKGPVFVRKHIVAKHPEELDKIKEKVGMFLLCVMCRPKRINFFATILLIARRLRVWRGISLGGDRQDETTETTGIVISGTTETSGITGTDAHALLLAKTKPSAHVPRRAMTDPMTDTTTGGATTHVEGDSTTADEEEGDLAQIFETSSHPQSLRYRDASSFSFTYFAYYLG